MDMHQSLLNILKLEKHKPFFPHLSLVYAAGKLPGVESIILPFSRELPANFGVNRLALVKTMGPVVDWRVMEVGSLVSPS